MGPRLRETSAKGVFAVGWYDCGGGSGVSRGEARCVRSGLAGGGAVEVVGDRDEVEVEGVGVQTEVAQAV